MSVLTVRVPDELDKIINQFCKEEDRTKSWLVKKAVQEKLEDWNDYRLGIKYLKEHNKTRQKSYTIEEIAKEFNITLK
ncbi:MAG: putative DNA-binding protein [Myxococcota bacterium]|jgi:predicted DNA-binding protein